jgi:hypothetical protein
LLAFSSFRDASNGHVIDHPQQTATKMNQIVQEALTITEQENRIATRPSCVQGMARLERPVQKPVFTSQILFLGRVPVKTQFLRRPSPTLSVGA